MNKHTKLLLAATLAVAAYSIAVGSASANRSIEIRGGSPVTAEGRIRGGDTERSIEISCNVTILRTVTRTVPKIVGTLFGKVTGVAIDRGEVRRPNCRSSGVITGVDDVIPLQSAGTPCRHTENGRGVLIYDCSGAEARLWKLIYDSFQGTLPEITGVNIHVQGYQDNIIARGPFGERIECLYEGNVFGLLTIRQPEATANSARVAEALTRLSLVRGSGFCPGRVSLEASFTVRPTITIRLL